MKENLAKWRLFFLWEKEKEERWLERMARDGWHFTGGCVRYKFKRGEPRDDRYRLDFRREYPHGKAEYYQMFRDAGWEHVSDFSHWHYFRSPAEAHAPEIYTDFESQAQMYEQLRRLVALILILNTVTLTHSASRSQLNWVKFLSFGVVCLLGYGLIRLTTRIRRLRATGAR